MAAREFTKTEKKKLHELAAEAHRRELAEPLRDLLSLFRDWQNSHLDEFEVAEAIHEFHDGPNRELYSLYNGLDPGFLVARGIARRLIDRDEVPKPILKVLQTQVDWFRKNDGSE